MSRVPASRSTLLHSIRLDGAVADVLADHLPDLIVQLPPGANKIAGVLDRHDLCPFLFQDLNDGAGVNAVLRRLFAGYRTKRLGDAIKLGVDAGLDLLR